MSKVVLTASKMGKVSFAEFCDEIGFVPKSATIRKHKAIGKKYELLSKHHEKLPFNWTTLYSISQIDEKELTEMLADERIHQSLKGNDAKRLAGIKSKKKSATVTNNKDGVPNGTLSGYAVHFQFSNAPADIIKIKDLIAQLENIGAAVAYSSSLEAFFDDSENSIQMAA
jgi:hypothetical protein